VSGQEPLYSGRLGLRVPKEAARSIGVSDEFFDTHVRPQVKVRKVGRVLVVSRRELERWLEENPERPESEERPS